MEAGYTGAPPPWALVKAWLCNFYGCLPSQLNDEPVDEALALWQLHQLYEQYRSKRPGGQGGSGGSGRPATVPRRRGRRR